MIISKTKTLVNVCKYRIIFCYISMIQNKCILKHSKKLIRVINIQQFYITIIISQAISCQLYRIMIVIIIEYTSVLRLLKSGTKSQFWYINNKSPFWRRRFEKSYIKSATYIWILHIMICYNNDRTNNCKIWFFSLIWTNPSVFFVLSLMNIQCIILNFNSTLKPIKEHQL